MSLESDLMEDFNDRVDLLRNEGHSEEMIEYILNKDSDSNWYEGR